MFRFGFFKGPFVSSFQENQGESISLRLTCCFCGNTRPSEGCRAAPGRQERCKPGRSSAAANAPPPAVAGLLTLPEERRVIHGRLLRMIAAHMLQIRVVVRHAPP